jgi:hypothetical protein
MATVNQRLARSRLAQSQCIKIWYPDTQPKPPTLPGDILIRVIYYDTP